MKKYIPTFFPGSDYLNCHTPKKMTSNGPALDTDLLLSGHLSQMPAPEVNRKEMESKGLASARPLLPPMPWQGISQMTDDELKAVFTYLKSTKPIKNLVPENQPPALAAK